MFAETISYYNTFYETDLLTINKDANFHDGSTFNRIKSSLLSNLDSECFAARDPTVTTFSNIQST